MDWAEGTFSFIRAAVVGVWAVLQDRARFGTRARHKQATRIEGQSAEFMVTLDMAIRANIQFYERIRRNRERTLSQKEPEKVRRSRDAVVQRFRDIVWRLRVHAHDAQLKEMLEKIASAFDHDPEEEDAGYAFSVAEGYAAREAEIRKNAAAIVDRMQELYKG